ncbi:MAG TPA: glycosyltransferase [Opitutaceae bacterium]|nr:glycosyltransferase [Opitutaceae bacterium]
MPSAPKISVLIPNYNCARFLPEAIDSVLMQDEGDYELIISDDRSHDGSADLLRRYDGRDPRLRLFFQSSNLGMVAHWNWCLEQARGEYVKFVFADDLLASGGTLGQMAARLRADPGIALVATARVVLDPSSRPVGTWSELSAGRHRGPELVARCLCADRSLVGEPSAVMFRRSAARRGFDPGWRQLMDLEMWFHLLSAGDLEYVAEPLCAFRLHPGQQSEANRRAKVGPEDRLHLFARYAACLPVDAAGRPRSATERRALFRCLYYSVHYASATPENRAAQTALFARLGRGWYRIYWLRHRLIKPLLNLARLLGRQKTPAG